MGSARVCTGHKTEQENNAMNRINQSRAVLPECSVIRIHTTNGSIMINQNRGRSNDVGEESAASCTGKDMENLFRGADKKAVCEDFRTKDSGAKTVMYWEKRGEVSFLHLQAALTIAEDTLGQKIFLDPSKAAELLFTEMREPDRKKESFLAVYQHKPWWIRPGFVTSLEEVPPRTQLLIRNSGNEFEVWLAVCAGHTRADLEGCQEGIRLRVMDGRCTAVQMDTLALAWGRGKNPFSLLEEMFAGVQEDQHHMFRLRKEKRYPELFRYFGWCTWDSLGQKVNENAILQKMKEFQEKNIPVRWVLIDDGWSEADMEKQTLVGIGAESSKFPQGLTHAVQTLRKTYGISKVGVWQAFAGYWNGVKEYSEAWCKTRPYLLKRGDETWSVNPDRADAFGFWDTWHKNLEEEGIDFVKIDGQSSFAMTRTGQESCSESFRNLYAGMEASVFQHFDGALINCMGMAPECVWNRGTSAISRTSDDYLPCAKGSFYEHALQNVFGNVYQGSLYYGDWDMFWSVHEDADRSALLRIISGGPVYASDGLGQSSAEILNKMMDRTGRLLMCSDIGLPTLDCLTQDPFQNDKGILKVWNRYMDTVLTACFCSESVTDGQVSTVLYREDIPALTGQAYLVWNSVDNKVSRFADSYEFSMTPGSTVLLELVPCHPDVTVIGCTDKYLPAAAVVQTDYLKQGCIIRVRCGGTYYLAAGRTIRKIESGGKELAFTEQNGMIKFILPEEEKRFIVWYGDETA